MSTAKKIIASTSGTAGGAGLNVEDVFATHLYTGSASDKRIYNYIDLANEGGMVWCKTAVSPTTNSDHWIVDTERGLNKSLKSNSDAIEDTQTQQITSFNSDGVTLGTRNVGQNFDPAPYGGFRYASWTFRKAPKFFDIVTYTGNATVRSIAHNLGSVPGMIIIKQLNTTRNWEVYHRGLAIETGDYPYILQLNRNVAQIGNQTFFKSGITSTEFKIAHYNAVNASGGSYVAYLFAHNDDDGGFGPNGDKDIIKCGSYTTDGNEDATINLGFEPQWLMVKRSDSSTGGDWRIIDYQRKWEALGNAHYVEANERNVGSYTGDGRYFLTSTGFKQDNFGANRSYIYMAIRRAPMAEIVDRAEVFEVGYGGSTSYTKFYSVGSPPKYHTWISPDDLLIYKRSDDTSPADVIWGVNTQLMGIDDFTSWATSTQTTSHTLHTHLDNAETTTSRVGHYPGTTGLTGGSQSGIQFLANNGSSQGNYVSYGFRRSPGFFDTVAYTGDGNASQTLTHNLEAIPKFIIVKGRSFTSEWVVYFGSGLLNVFLNTDDTQTGLGAIHKTGGAYQAIDSTTQFDVVKHSGGNASKSLNTSGENYIALIFGSLDGISKVGSYTGTGSDLDVDCGFTNGVKFVLIKKTDNPNTDWYLFDSSRGIGTGADPAGRDPALFPNKDANDLYQGTDFIDSINSGFKVRPNSGTLGKLNTSGGNYIFYAIAT